MQCVERVEELLLRLGLAGQELNVVDQEDVHIPICALEAIQRTGAQSGDEVIGEGLDCRVPDDGAAAEGGDVITDGVEKVRLTQTRWCVQEQRVVGGSRKL